MAATRVGDPDHIKFALPTKEGGAPLTRNVVFSEVLLNSPGLSGRQQEIPAPDPTLLEFPEDDFRPGDLDDREGAYGVEAAEEDEEPAPDVRRRVPRVAPAAPNVSRSCSPARDVAPARRPRPWLPVVSAEPQCEYERIRLGNIEVC